MQANICCVRHSMCITRSPTDKPTDSGDLNLYLNKVLNNVHGRQIKKRIGLTITNSQNRYKCENESVLQV